MKLNIYLAGKMGGLTHFEMNSWRKIFSSTMGIGFNIINNINIINPVEFYNFEIDRDFTDKEVREFDLNAVRNSDIVVVKLSNGHFNSLGTAQELMLANELKIPVIGICPQEELDTVHPWMKLSVSKMCNYVEDAVEYINEFYIRMRLGN